MVASRIASDYLYDILKIDHSSLFAYIKKDLINHNNGLKGTWSSMIDQFACYGCHSTLYSFIPASIEHDNKYCFGDMVVCTKLYNNTSSSEYRITVTFLSPKVGEIIFVLSKEHAPAITGQLTGAYIGYPQIGESLKFESKEFTDERILENFYKRVLEFREKLAKQMIEDGNLPTLLIHSDTNENYGLLYHRKEEHVG